MTAPGTTRPRGGIWFDVQVRFVVTSLVYTGRMTARRRTGSQVDVPPIVGDELADLARHRLAARYRKPPPRTRHHHLLTGLATCASCQGVIGVTGHRRSGGEAVHSYLCLGRRYAAGPHACDLPMLRTSAVDDRVWSALIDALATETVLDRALGRPTSTVDPGAVARAEAEVARLDALQEAVLEQQLRRVISQAVGARQLERLGRERQAAIAALRSAQAEVAGIRPAIDRAELAEAVRLMRADADHMDREQRRELMRAAAERVVVGPDVIAIDLLIDASPVGLGEHACRSVFSGHPRLSAGTLRILTPARRAS